MVNNSKLIHFRVKLIRNTNLVQTRVSICHQSTDRATPADNYDHSDKIPVSAEEKMMKVGIHSRTMLPLFLLKSYFKLTLGTIEFALEVEHFILKSFGENERLNCLTI